MPVRPSIEKIRAIGGGEPKNSLPLVFAVAILAACIVFLVPADWKVNFTKEENGNPAT